ncbi:MAG TPA: glycosyltransferase family 39 protein [Acidothermaceae bacterium]
MSTAISVRQSDATGETPRAPRGRRLLYGNPTDPRWARPALLVLLVATALLYLVDLGASGWANSFYSAAVQAGSHSWKAFFFGSSDSSNFITVDKPPASLWVMELSARVFGVNSWSILVPQALEGVATVALLYATVRRWFTPAAALIAGTVMALTPVAVLMFRFNNPDALLTLLLVAAAYAVTRALETASTRWLALAGTLVGFGFLAKMMQAFLVVPAFAFVYLVAAPTPLRRRFGQLLLAGVAMLVAAGWWVVAVALTPATARPYIGGSQHNSIIELIFGYNGFGRLTGNETGSVTGGAGRAGGPGGNAGGMWGATGWHRLFSSEMGSQVSWLIPAALVVLLGVLWMSRREPRTSRLRSASLLWGLTLLVTGLTISFSKGIIHPYYTIALAPAIGALVGIGGVELWRARHQLVPGLFLAAAVAVSTWWAYMLLDRTPTFQPWLRTVVVVVGLVSAVGIAVGIAVGRRGPKGVAMLVASSALVTAIAAPAAFAVNTAATPHTGAIPSAGPSSGQAGPGGFAGPGGAGRPGGFARPGGAPGGFAGPGGFGGPAGPGAGGLLQSSVPSAALTALLKTDASAYTWVAAAVGSNSASGYQLASDEPVMAIGGFNGSDPSPTLAQFQQLVSERKIHYFIGGDGIGAANGGSNASSQIASWVQSHYAATTVGGVTLYDLTKAAS